MWVVGGGDPTISTRFEEGPLLDDLARAVVDAGIRQVQDLVMDDNTFIDNNRGFTLFKFYDGAGRNAEDLAITNNRFTDESQSSIILFAIAPSGGLTGTNVIRGNTINADVSVMTANFGKIDIRLDSGFVHGPVLIDQNTVTFSGAFGAGATSAHAIKPRGNVAGIRITANVLNGAPERSKYSARSALNS